MMMMIWQWCALNSVIICILSAITQNNAGMICALTKAEQKSFKSKPMWSNRRVHQQQNCRQLTHYRTFGSPIRVIAYAHERNSIQPGAFVMNIFEIIRNIRAQSMHTTLHAG